MMKVDLSARVHPSSRGHVERPLVGLRRGLPRLFKVSLGCAGFPISSGIAQIEELIMAEL